MKRIGLLIAISVFTLTVVSVGYSHPIVKTETHKIEKAITLKKIVNNAEVITLQKAFDFEVPSIVGLNTSPAVETEHNEGQLACRLGFDFGTWKVKPPALQLTFLG